MPSQRGIGARYRWAIEVYKWIATPVVLTTVGISLLQCSPAPPPQPATSSPPLPSVTTATDPQAPGSATVRPVTAAELGASWRPGCPVGPETLRRVEVDYVGFDGQTHRGELIVHQDLVADVVAIFEQLHRLRYPITKMRTVDHYPGADDELSMEDNNSSAFNCRPMPSGRSWSLHAFGRAVDLNPLLNPFIDSRGAFQPSNAAPYLDRRRTDPGILHGDDAAVRVFTDRGWRWGGDWRTPKDYQHFERR